jgi:hypothetical protein
MSTSFELRSPATDFIISKVPTTAAYKSSVKNSVIAKKPGNDNRLKYLNNKSNESPLMPTPLPEKEVAITYEGKPSSVIPQTPTLRYGVLTNSVELKTKDQLIEKIKEWVKIDNEIRVLQK